MIKVLWYIVTAIVVTVLVFSGCVKYVYLDPETNASYHDIAVKCAEREKDLQLQLNEALKHIEELQKCP